MIYDTIISIEPQGHAHIKTTSQASTHCAEQPRKAARAVLMPMPHINENIRAFFIFPL
jgi:hypothetical protein